MFVGHTLEYLVRQVSIWDLILLYYELTSLPVDTSLMLTEDPRPLGQRQRNLLLMAQEAA